MQVFVLLALPRAWRIVDAPPSPSANPPFAPSPGRFARTHFGLVNLPRCRFTEHGFARNRRNIKQSSAAC